MTVQELRKVLKQVPFNMLLGMRLRRVHRDGITIECTVRDELRNSAGLAHGGVAAALADAAVGVAIQAHFKGGRRITTVEMKINYFLPVKDGRLVGRGAADMKGGLAAMIAAAEAVQRAEVPLQGELVLAAVADEEEGNLGTRRLVQSGLRGTWAIVPEPTELLPVVAHKGSANIHVAIHGSAAHASTPEQGVNAINHASALIARLNALNVDYQRIRQHDLLGSPTLTICTINGGFNDYTVPAACALTLNRRLVPPETDRDVIAELSGVFDELAQTDPSFKADLQLSAFTPPMETDVDSEVVRALRSASARVSGVDPGVSGWSATCDASILSHAANIPTVVFGPGSIARDAHRPDESVAVSELVACARIFAITIQELLGGEA